MSDSTLHTLAFSFAPTGTVRASINLGNPILAGKDAGGAPVGVSVDLARELARRLGTPIDLLTFDKAAASVAAVKGEQADIGFFAIDPARSEGLCFTAPYVLIEGAYLVRDDSPLTDNAQVDVTGMRVGVVSGSAYDLFLTRHLQAAELVRQSGGAAEGGKSAFAALRAGQIEVAAGIRQVLELEAARATGVRLLPGRFMVIEQAMGLPAGRGEATAAALAAFVEEMKTTGFVAEALQRHGVQGARVAPAAD